MSINWQGNFISLLGGLGLFYIVSRPWRFVGNKLLETPSAFLLTNIIVILSLSFPWY